MNHSALKKFAQNTRKKLITQIGVRLDYVLKHDDPYLRSHAAEKQTIEKLLLKKGREQLLEETAYIWFNRLTALRFMDNRGYNTVKIVSPVDGETQPQLLAEIKQGRMLREIAGKAADITMAHLGARAFDSIGGEVVQTTAFVIEREYRAGYKGAYIRLVDGKSEAEKAKMFKEAIK